MLIQGACCRISGFIGQTNIHFRYVMRNCMNHVIAVLYLLFSFSLSISISKQETKAH